jgi:hypothetical protein
MPNFHIDAILGPERNPRQGVGAADILRWQEGWRKWKAEQRGTQRLQRRREREVESAVAVTVQGAGHMDSFFGKPAELPGAPKSSPPGELKVGW